MASSEIKATLLLKGRVLREYAFEQPVVTIGREPSADIFIDNISVSRAHAQMRHEGDSVVLEDLGSANGTFVNKQRVQKAALQTGDVIELGKFEINVDLPPEVSQPVQAAPAVKRGTGGVGGRTINLSPEDLLKVREATLTKMQAKQADMAIELPTRKSSAVFSHILMLLLGAALGAAGAWLLLR